jgi:hypothetical protein
MVRTLGVIVAALLAITAATAEAACTHYARVTAWTGTIAVSYDRSARTPNYLEHSSGGSNLIVDYTPSFMSAISLNGYDETWIGHRSGNGRLIDEQMNADGSPLSRPVRLEGSGAVLADPPLGRFGPEQLWISSTKCAYAFYTSSAINATHSRDGATVAGTDVHVEGIPLPASGALTSSRRFHLPNATNYEGGDQFHFPCLLVDWCNRDAGTGTGTVTWTFSPAGARAPSPKPPQRPRCPNADAAGSAPGDPLRRDFQIAFSASGHAVPLGDISAAKIAGVSRITVRLAANGSILPSSQCIDEGIANGSVRTGSQPGAQKLLIATVQQANGQTRVTVRINDVATGVIDRSGLGDASGTNDASIRQAAAQALQQLGPL